MTCLFLPIICNCQNINPYLPDFSKPAKLSNLKLVFSEEFNYTGKPDTAIWNYEHGYVRNQELQWYQSENANCSDGRLLIDGRRANFPNPTYSPNTDNWKLNRDTVRYVSASITTMGKKSWKFGRFEVRAKIDTAMGSWPAIWTIGDSMEWPSCGEIDLLELYRIDNLPTILANVASGTTKRWNAKWDQSKTLLAEWIQKDSDWVKKYHVWRMDWTKDSINLYIDNSLINTTPISETVNPDGTQPFLQPHYILLNLALGANGGNPEKSKFPITFEVDYVRVYQQTAKNE